MDHAIAKQAVPHGAPGAQPMPGGATFLPLSQEARALIPTECAAFHLNRKVQTLRAWACLETGPIRPVRVTRGGPLGWRTEDVRRLVGVSQ